MNSSECTAAVPSDATTHPMPSEIALPPSPQIQPVWVSHNCSIFASRWPAGWPTLNPRSTSTVILACRNCFINTGMTVKVGNFGMAQKLYASDYVRVCGQVVLPIRWMAPESIIYGIFSLQSDVWSFGVVVWEVFSFALQPYFGLANGDITDMILCGKLLCKKGAQIISSPSSRIAAGTWSRAKG